MSTISHRTTSGAPVSASCWRAGHRSIGRAIAGHAAPRTTKRDARRGAAVQKRAVDQRAAPYIARMRRERTGRHAPRRTFRAGSTRQRRGDTVQLRAVSSLLRRPGRSLFRRVAESATYRRAARRRQLRVRDRMKVWKYLIIGISNSAPYGCLSRPPHRARSRHPPPHVSRSARYAIPSRPFGGIPPAVKTTQSR